MTAKITSLAEPAGGGKPKAAAEKIAGYAPLAADIFRTIRELSKDGPGVTRPSYGDAEQRALQTIADLARDEGLEPRWDEAANLTVTLAGRQADRGVIATGSHMDSVPVGGNFDGAAGVVAGLISLIHMKRAGATPPRDVRLYGFRGEESAWFGTCYIGSRALLGELSAEDLKAAHRETGQPLEDYMGKAGADVAAIAAGRKLIRPEDIAGFVELHIEQGPVLVDRKLPVGIVTGIRGNIRHQAIVCRGEAGHSGTVPRWLRHDAVLAVADLLTRLDEHWRVLLERGIDLVITTGMIGTDPAQHALSVIPGEVRFSLEIRSQSVDTLETFYGLVQAECRAVAAQRGVTFDFDRRVNTSPGRIDGAWIAHLEELAKEHHIECCRLPSGAGHDAAVMANAGIPSAMIFVRNRHGSHNAQESMDLDDFMKGTELLYHALVRPAL